MSVLQRGDRLVISELSRLGRSLGQIVAILDALAKAGMIFYTLKEAKVLIERWRQEYNRLRPHSSLGYRPPAPEATCLKPPAAAP